MAAQKVLAGSSMVGVRVTPVDPAASSVGVRVDFSGFAKAFGAGYASRLQLYSVPLCLATTPDDDACRPVPLAVNRDLQRQVIEAAVPVQQPALAAPVVPAVTPAPSPSASAGPASTPSPSPAPSASAKSAASASPGDGARPPDVQAADVQGGQAVVVAASSASGSAGDFTATPLQASGSWEAGGSSGNFHYAYPVPVPPTVGGPLPDLGLEYDSQAVDGRTSETNGQVSAAGQGWDIQTGFIERRFRTCRDDGQTYDDLCWGGAPYVININGQSHDLIPSTGGQVPLDFRFRDDPGWTVTLKRGATNGSAYNEDNDGDWFDVHSPDGTRYVFGYGKTPWTSTAASHSGWTVPVFGDDPGEPCHQSTFQTSQCQKTWRFNLDWIQDKHADTVSGVSNRLCK